MEEIVNDSKINSIYKRLISDNALTTQLDNYVIEAFNENSHNCLYLNLKYKVKDKYNDLEWLIKQINNINALSMTLKIFLVQNEININSTVILSGKLTQNTVLNVIEKAIAFSKSIDQYLEYEWSMKNN